MESKRMEEGQQKRRITMMTSNNTHLLPDCVENNGLNGTESKSIQQAERMRKCPTLTADHKKARMNFARNSPFFHVHVAFRYKLQSIQVIFKRRLKLDGMDCIFIVSCYRITQRCHPRELQYKELFSVQEYSLYGLAVSVTKPKSHEKSL
uniref:Ovule protein n=1 Tax=Heterorhabditis bacteriophora TaxID=37862 RepID=A0A1I7WFH0_HETBA